jgi:hypothetical protein
MVGLDGERDEFGPLFLGLAIVLLFVVDWFTADADDPDDEG